MPLLRRPQIAILSILFLTPLLWLSQSVLAASVGDEYLAGYISSILERELRWAHGSYVLQVDRGVATITLKEDDRERRALATQQLQNINGLQSFQFRSAANGPEVSASPQAAPDSPGKDTSYPVGDVFRPLLADPRQPRFFISLREYDMPAERLTTAAVGFGETFGLYRIAGRTADDGVQVGLDGGLFALFNLDEPTRELVNADYSIGVPLTWRRGDNSARLRLYHQSSHLGDGYPQRAGIRPVLLSYEALSVMYSHEWQGLRAYLGGEYRFDFELDSLKHVTWQGGVEYYGTQRLWGGTRLVAAVDLKSTQQNQYALDANVQLGLEAGGTEPGQRRLRVMLEGYRGYSPDGQLFDNFITAYGVGIYLGL